jgi:predicted phosphodiesterase
MKQNFANYEDKKTRIPVKGNIIRFGVVSDTHLGSKYCQVSYLRWTYDYFKKQGAEFILHSGDIVDGQNVYRGQEFEVHAHGFDEQLEFATKNYPNGLPTYFISGNHCLSWFERGGADIGVALANNREDLHYLGQLGAYVYVNSVKIYLVHGMGIPAYAISYKSQKMVEAFSTENKPNMLIVGHFHSAFQSFIRNIYAMHGSSFQGQTPFLRRRAIFPVIGGYLIEIDTSKKGVERFKFEFLPMYRPKANDWKDYV